MNADRGGDGLFPAPKSIELSCSCPDGASLGKHVATTVYSVGARLDLQSELLFILRGVDQRQPIQCANPIPAAVAGKAPSKPDKVLRDTELETF